MVQHFTTTKKRVFDVKVENVMVAPKLDVFASAGGIKKAYVIELNNTDCRDGKVTIEFVNSVNNPILSGVEVVRYGQPKTCGVPKVRTHFRSEPCRGVRGGLLVRDSIAFWFVSTCIYSFSIHRGLARETPPWHIRFILPKVKEE